MPALPQVTSRHIKADTDYGGIAMKKDWLVVSYLKAPQLNSKTYQEPHLFLPERWFKYAIMP